MDKELYNFESVYKVVDSIFDEKYEKPNESCSEIYKKLKEEYNEIGDSFITHCNKSAKYLEYLDEYYKGNINTAKGIIYVYCWLYDVEFNKAQYNKNGINIYKKFLNEYTLIESMSNIPSIFQTYLKGNIDENLKNLYDLYYKFDKFKNKVKCENSYCKCAEECSNIYKKYKQEKCGNDDNTDFCKELHNFERHYNDYLKAHNTCDGNSYIRVILFPILITSIISFIVFFLFKFTTLGSRLCLRSKNKKKKWNNVDEEIRDIRNPSKTFHNIAKANPYTLGYHSIDHTP